MTTATIPRSAIRTLTETIEAMPEPPDEPSTIRPTVLNVADYNEARILQALQDRVRERGEPPLRDRTVWRVVAKASRPPGPVGGTTTSLWPPSPDADAETAPRTPAETYRLGNPERRRVGKLGGVGWEKGAVRGECWAPALFGTLEREPTITVLEETRDRMRVKVKAEGLARLVDLFGFRAPVATVAWLEGAARRTRLARIRKETRETRAKIPAFSGVVSPNDAEPA